tara:strand:+ start:3463 stop:4158 length:696 start_codon:yes stop_codon:yes gene_type:complete
MDPISAMATASAAFGAIKKGFAVGRDIEQMAGDLSRWMGAMSDLEQAEREAKNPPIFKKLFAGQSVEQEAITAFANKEKAKQQRYELQQWISLTMGRSKWEELVRMEGQIRKTRKETLYKQRERRQKFVEFVAWTVMVCIASALLYAFVMFLKGTVANAADPEYVTCRLKGCTKIDDQRVCVYHGVNNTVDTLFFRMEEWFPREFQCKYDPNDTKPPSIQETLEAIRKSQN